MKSTISCHTDRVNSCSQNYSSLSHAVNSNTICRLYCPQCLFYPRKFKLPWFYHCLSALPRNSKQKNYIIYAYACVLARYSLARLAFSYFTRTLRDWCSNVWEFTASRNANGLANWCLNFCNKYLPIILSTFLLLQKWLVIQFLIPVPVMV